MGRKHKDLELLSIAFLDMMTGALAAVIFLFVLIPKKTNHDKEILEKYERSRSKIDSLDIILKNSLSQPEYDLAKLKLMVFKDELNEMQGERQNLSDELAISKQRLQELLDAVKDLTEKLDSCQYNRKTLEGQLAALANKPGADDIKKYYEYYQWMKQCGYKPVQDCPAASTGKDLDVGFKLQGKNVVFVVDVSGSMIDNDYAEDRLEPLKGGLKMLISTFDKSYQFDVVTFPNVTKKGCTDYYSKWGSLMPATLENKYEAFTFIYEFEAGGSTPIRATLKYVLDTYPDATDIILLSDGEPTKTCSSDEPDPGVASYITSINAGKVKISCVGVGRDYYENPSSEFVKFMRELSGQNRNGFFIGY